MALLLKSTRRSAINVIARSAKGNGHRAHARLGGTLVPVLQTIPTGTEPQEIPEVPSLQGIVDQEETLVVPWMTPEDAGQETPGAPTIVSGTEDEPPQTKNLAGTEVVPARRTGLIDGGRAAMNGHPVIRTRHRKSQQNPVTDLWSNLITNLLAGTPTITDRLRLVRLFLSLHQNHH
jgi:hypothetical protein